MIRVESWYAFIVTDIKQLEDRFFTDSVPPHVWNAEDFNFDAESMPNGEWSKREQLSHDW